MLGSIVDREVRRWGQTVTLQRGLLSIDLKALVRTGESAAELTGGVTATGVRVILSALELTRAGWPGAPAKLDKIVIDGRVRNVDVVVPRRIGEDAIGYVLHVH